MSWFLVQSVLPTKTWVLAAGLVPHFWGMWLVGDGTSIGSKVIITLKVITPWTIT